VIIEIVGDLNRLNTELGELIPSTVLRAGNTDDRVRLEAILDRLSKAPLPVVLPVHPRTEKRLQEYGLWGRATREPEVIGRMGYLDFVRLLDASKRVAIDSGGVQREAFYLDTPCVTIGEATEWTETVESGWNILAGVEQETISRPLRRIEIPEQKPTPCGDGNAAAKIVDVLEENTSEGEFYVS
jgi:UDP-N-acetylglucosamine 2-epimerase (non-hydrolysing)